MVHQFDSAAKTYRSGKGRSAEWAVWLPGRQFRSQFYVDESNIPPGLIGHVSKPRAGFCDVTGHANERTMSRCDDSCRSRLREQGSDSRDQRSSASSSMGCNCQLVCGRLVPTSFSHDDHQLPLSLGDTIPMGGSDQLSRAKAGSTCAIAHLSALV